eukprot:3872802-Pyramimonas_sp.AAC.1
MTRKTYENPQGKPENGHYQLCARASPLPWTPPLRASPQQNVITRTSLFPCPVDLSGLLQTSTGFSESRSWCYSKALEEGLRGSMAWPGTLWRGGAQRSQNEGKVGRTPGRDPGRRTKPG